jgi:hypothetical protein
MKIDCTKVLLDLDGKPLQDIRVDSDGKVESYTPTLGQLLSKVLISQKQGFDQAKAYDLCQRFYCDKTVELDDPDTAMLRSIVDRSDSLNVLSRGRILDTLK